MSMYYSSEVTRALYCARIHDVRGRCADGFVFERPRRSPSLTARLRSLFVNRPSTPECC